MLFAPQAEWHRIVLISWSLECHFNSTPGTRRKTHGRSLPSYRVTFGHVVNSLLNLHVELLVLLVRTQSLCSSSAAQSSNNITTVSPCESSRNRWLMAYIYKTAIRAHPPFGDILNIYSPFIESFIYVHNCVKQLFILGSCWLPNISLWQRQQHEITIEHNTGTTSVITSINKYMN